LNILCHNSEYELTLLILAYKKEIIPIVVTQGFLASDKDEE